ncbi:MAG: YeeE/YedE family protein [Afipia felis]|nr:YeeE/YedE family protein [Afipia felis]
MAMSALLRLLVSLATGAIFGFGLSLSGMVDPARVIGFLDVASGHWDPSLAFVLGGALLVALPGVAIQRRMARPALDEQFHLPTRTVIDRPLVLGSAIFGVGWGLGGLCPGPAVAALSIGLVPSFIFAAAMAAGMMLYDHVLTRK